MKFTSNENLDDLVYCDIKNVYKYIYSKVYRNGLGFL